MRRKKNGRNIMAPPSITTRNSQLATRLQSNMSSAIGSLRDGDTMANRERDEKIRTAIRMRNKPTLADYFSEVYRRYGDEMGWRMGQTYFNVLYEMRPDLSERIRSTPIDPFYQDVYIPAFLTFVAENWNG